MKTYSFTGTVYFYEDVKVGNAAAGRELTSIQTTLAIKAPSKRVAKAILDHYGMESIQRAELAA